MNDIVLAPDDSMCLCAAAPAFGPAAKTGEITADAARAPAAPASMSRRDRVGRDVSEVSFMFDFCNLGSLTGSPSKLLICFSMGGGCALHSRISIMGWYRSGDVI